MHTHEDRIVVFEREARAEKSKTYGRHTLWVGCHVDDDSENILGSALTCLSRRIQHELHLWSRLEPEFLGLAWDKSQQETQHLGVMFRAPIASELVAEHLENKLFKKMARSGKLRSVFMTQEQIVYGLSELDLNHGRNTWLATSNSRNPAQRTPLHEAL